MSLPFSSETRELGRRFQEFVSGQWLCNAITSQSIELGNGVKDQSVSLGGCKLDPAIISKSIQSLTFNGISKIHSIVRIPDRFNPKSIESNSNFQGNKLNSDNAYPSTENGYYKKSKNSQNSDERNWLMQLVKRSLDWEIIQGQKRSRKGQAEVEERALAIALASNKKATLLEFYSQKCRLCRSLNSVLDEMEREYGDWLTIVKADVGNKFWLPEVGHYNIHYVPCFVLLDSNGFALVRTGAPYSREHVLTGLSYIVESVQPVQGSLHPYSQTNSLSNKQNEVKN